MAEAKKHPSTSTPNVPSARQPIHKESLSPIPVANELLKKRYVQNMRTKNQSAPDSDNEDESDDSYTLSDTESPPRRSYSSNSSVNYSPQYSNCQTSSVRTTSRTTFVRSTDRNTSQSEGSSKMGLTIGASLFAVVTAIATVLGLNSISPGHTNVTISNLVTIEELRDRYPLQLDDTWYALESGIKEIKAFNKPSVFLLLYEDGAEETANKILTSMSKYATCILNQNCDIVPIVLQSSDLSTSEMKRDYGHVINKYKPELEKRAVMIVKQLDKVPGEVAQAFHSMCDEYTPLVDKTAFFFTMNANSEKSKTDLQLVEEVLRFNWNNLDGDIFYPLLTRISNMVLRVIPEKL